MAGICPSKDNSSLHQTLSLSAASGTEDSGDDLSLSAIPPWRQYDHHCWMPSYCTHASNIYQTQLPGWTSHAMQGKAPSQASMNQKLRVLRLRKYKLTIRVYRDLTRATMLLENRALAS
ncbi:hypothetical protein RF11_01741 [Thelohanellus kitauei]|uniref:Uncharacterized protein n=1 Tax=Thelohanellus kitauei TaxID=669202 RepID=A0A0C2M9M6_THEKT|nr:hypothetical protein RF11_01741 [Thelohanellus kitauei]